MSAANPLSRRELVAWILLALVTCGAAYLVWENYSLKRAFAVQVSRGVGSAFSQALGSALSVTKRPEKSSTEENLPVNGATLQLESVLDEGKHLKFDDGSFWEAESPRPGMSSKWTKGQNVTVVATKNAYDQRGWKLMNEEAGASVDAKPLLVPKPGTAARPRAEKNEPPAPKAANP